MGRVFFASCYNVPGNNRAITKARKLIEEGGHFGKVLLSIPERRTECFHDEKRAL